MYRDSTSAKQNWFTISADVPPHTLTLMKHIYKNTRWDSGVVRPIGLMITIMAICIGFLAWVLKNYHDEQEIAKFRVPPLTESVR